VWQQGECLTTGPWSSVKISRRSSQKFPEQTDGKRRYRSKPQTRPAQSVTSNHEPHNSRTIRNRDPKQRKSPCKSSLAFSNCQPSAARPKSKHQQVSISGRRTHASDAHPPPNPNPSSALARYSSQSLRARPKYYPFKTTLHYPFETTIPRGSQRVLPLQNCDMTCRN
jgi:hypothetical protein